MRRFGSALICVSTAFLAVLAVTPAAQAATDVTRYFRIDYGNTYSAGSVTWYNRSVRVTGEEKAISSSGCRYTNAETLFPDGNLMAVAFGYKVCSGSTKYTLDVPAPVRGGANRVKVIFMACNSAGSDCKRVGEAALYR